ncbi:MAG: CapA family protein [Synergistaceae bacterium]|nr:CapA family protein [Synergistaceae bacterium]
MKSARKLAAFAALFFSIFSILSVPAFSQASGETIKARAVFVGDIMAHAEQLKAARYEASWDFKPQFRRVKPLIWKALAVGNLETVFAGDAYEFGGYPVFNTPDELASALDDLGMDIVTIANNHILDLGYDAAKRTADVLDRAGIFWTGLSAQEDPDEPLVVEYAGLRWAFVNFSCGSDNKASPAPGDLRLNLISEEAVVSALKRASSYEPDVTVAYLHWGLEYQYSPAQSQRKIAALCVQNGADIVVGSHPHVLQPLEITSNDKGYAAIAYSLGNFISSIRSASCERSVVLAVEIEKNERERARISRVSIAPTWVSAREANGRQIIEVVYAGTGGSFNHNALPETELATARRAGKQILEFLGASGQADKYGFYTLWDAVSPDKTPHPAREAPE